MKTRTSYVLQYEYNCKAPRDTEDNWQWIDDWEYGAAGHPGGEEEQLARARMKARREQHARIGNPKFTRTFRLVRRTITINDEVLDG